MEFSRRKRRRRSFWDQTTEAYFVDLWGQKIDELRGTKKHTHVYQEMSADLAQHGIELSVPDIKYKIGNLTSKYRKCRETLESTDGASVSWPLYEQVHQIIGWQSSNNTDIASEDSIEHKFNLVEETSFLTQQAASLSASSFDTNAFTLPPPYITELPTATNARASKRQNSERIISTCEYLKKSADEKNQLMKEMVKIEREKLAVLKDLRDDNKKLTQAILSYLSSKQ